MAAEPKTKPTAVSVAAFVEALLDETRRKDAKALLKMFKEITGDKPVMWGPTIIGYGSYDQPYANGKTIAWPRSGFSPRKAELVLYLLPDYLAATPKRKTLGKHRVGKSCLYVKTLVGVDVNVLKAMLADSHAEMAKRYP